jgi:hypothetical protein
MVVNIKGKDYPMSTKTRSVAYLLNARKQGLKSLQDTFNMVAGRIDVYVELGIFDDRYRNLSVTSNMIMCLIAEQENMIKDAEDTFLRLHESENKVSVGGGGSNV